MATLNFPTSPSLNDTYTFGGKTWVWNGQGWQLQNQGSINGIVIGNTSPAAGTFTTLSATGNITGSYIIGNGSQLTGLPASYANSNVATYLASGTNSSNIVTTGNVSGTYFLGNGSQLTGISASGGGGIIWTTVANTAPSSPNAGDFWYNSYTGVKYQYTNDGTGNVWVDQSFPTSFASLTTGTLSASSNITGGNVLTGGIVSSTGNITAGNLSVSTGTVTVGNIVNSNANGVGNIGSSTTYFNTAFVNATSAQYADLAEYYKSDADYPPSTVVVFGGDEEITISNKSHDTRVAGVVSTQPAYIMNSQCKGLPVALTGRVPCQVQGPVDKGDVLVTGVVPGIAQRIGMEYQPGCVLGKSLEAITDASISVIEVVVGRF